MGQIMPQLSSSQHLNFNPLRIALSEIFVCLPLSSGNVSKWYCVSSCWLYPILCVLVLLSQQNFSWEFWETKVDILHIDSFDGKIRQKYRNVNRKAQAKALCVSRCQSVMGCTGWRVEFDQKSSEGLFSPWAPLAHSRTKWWLCRVCLSWGQCGLLWQTVLAWPRLGDSPGISQTSSHSVMGTWEGKLRKEVRGSSVHGWGQGVRE